MTNLSSDARHALQLYRKLVEKGLDPDFAELQVEKRAEELETRSVDGLAGRIVEDAPEKWKSGEGASSGGSTDGGGGTEESSGGRNYYDRLRARIEAERAEKRKTGSGDAVRERLQGGGI